MKLSKRKPDWFRVRPFTGTGYDRVSGLLKRHNLNTVCQAANCPNRGECFNKGTATFLIMGPNCTRNCRFCDINTGKPRPLDPEEPRQLALMSAELKLNHVVVTSVARDDLPDGGAEHFAEVVREIRRELPKASVELLTPDFRGVVIPAADIIIKAHPDVFNHNVETVPRLYSAMRAGAEYERSRRLLRYVGNNSDIVTKSGIMVGVGETLDELKALFADLAEDGVSILTIGQYLPPSPDHFPLDRYVHPDEFAQLKVEAERAGIRQAVSSPLVRSSYRAEEFRNLRDKT